MASSALAPRQGARRSGFSRDRGAPGAGDRDRLVAAGPGRHGDGKERERRLRLGAELEMGSQGIVRHRPGNYPPLSDLRGGVAKGGGVRRGRRG